MTPAQKKAYNEKYYREHSSYWKDFYSKGRLVGRQKHVTEGNGGVKRRGEGLGTGPVGSGYTKERSVDSTGALNSWASLVEQTGTPMQSYAYNQAIGNPTPSEPPPMTYYDLEQYLTTTFFDNAMNAARAVKSKAASAGKDFVRSWKAGATSIKNLFKMKR